VLRARQTRIFWCAPGWVALASDGWRAVARFPVAKQQRVEVTADDSSIIRAVLKLPYKRMHILPPIGKPKRYAAPT
jgi:hypothetical protein